MIVIPLTMAKHPPSYYNLSFNIYLDEDAEKFYQLTNNGLRQVISHM
jgi:hypothetical protein